MPSSRTTISGFMGLHAVTGANIAIQRIHTSSSPYMERSMGNIAKKIVLRQYAGSCGGNK